MIQDFLYRLQDRYFILICFFVTLAVYMVLRLDAILQLAINFGVAIIALSQKKQEPQTQIQTDTMNTDQMDVSADKVNVSKTKETK